MIEQEVYRAMGNQTISSGKWKRRTLLALITALCLVGAGCSSDDEAAEDDSSTETSAAADSTETETETDASVDEEAEGADPIEDAPTEAEDPPTEEEEEPEAAASEEEEVALIIELGEWFLTAPEGLTAGSLSFAVANVGENPHAFAVVKGDRYEDLPQLDNGAVDVDALGDDYLGTTDNLQVGESGEITFELEAGNYVFFCPVQFGPNSHAAAGQVLSVAVG